MIASDRRTLALLVLQAPLLGLLMLWRLPSGELGPPPEDTLRVLSSASIVLFNLVIGATWIGMSSAAREIVKELPQFRRECAAGLSLSAYLASKVAVLVFVVTCMVTAGLGLSVRDVVAPLRRTRLVLFALPVAGGAWVIKAAIDDAQKSINKASGSAGAFRR